MKCIDFDQAFSRYVMSHFEVIGKNYANYDAMEAAIPDLYQAFLQTPADFLGGICPAEYFDRFDDPKELIDGLLDYIHQDIPVPDMLLNRISELGSKAESRLMVLLQNENAPQEARMYAVSLLQELDSQLPMQFYVNLQLNRTAEDELADAAAEALLSMGSDAVPLMTSALDFANDAGKEALCGILCHYPDITGCVLRELLRLITLPEADVALLAGYLGMLGDDAALETLIDIALDDKIDYLTYIELRSAIEELGGEAPERDFDQDDPQYEAMSRLQSFPKGESPDESEGEEKQTLQMPSSDGDYLQ